MLDTKLKGMGFQTKLLRGSSIPNNINRPIADNDKLAALILGDENLSIVVNSSRKNDLSKLLSKFQLTKINGNMTGADKGGWDGKVGAVKNHNPGDIMFDGQGGMDNVHWVRLMRSPQQKQGQEQGQEN